MKLDLSYKLFTIIGVYDQEIKEQTTILKDNLYVICCDKFPLFVNASIRHIFKHKIYKRKALSSSTIFMISGKEENYKKTC